jgi:Protein of unknown function (DUF2892)
MLKNNVGGIDKIARIVLGVALIAFAIIEGQIWAYIGIVPLFTGLFGTCPLYSIFGISTCPISSKKVEK